MTGRDPAKARFVAVQAVRWMGVAMTVTGLLVAERKIAAPVEAGYAIIVIGVLAAFIAPILLARMWKTPK